MKQNEQNEYTSCMLLMFSPQLQVGLLLLFVHFSAGVCFNRIYFYAYFVRSPANLYECFYSTGTLLLINPGFRCIT